MRGISKWEPYFLFLRTTWQSQLHSPWGFSQMSPTCSCLALRHRVLSLALPVWRVGQVRQHVSMVFGQAVASSHLPRLLILGHPWHISASGSHSTLLPVCKVSPFRGRIQPSFFSQRLQCLLSFLLPTQNFGACCPPGAYVKEKRPPGQLQLILAWHECCGMAGFLLAPIPSCFFMEKIIPRLISFLL